jgi:arginine deiminase
MIRSRYSIDRRNLLLGMGTLLPTALLAHPADAVSPPFVASETGHLKTVLVHPLSAADHARCALAQGAHPVWEEAIHAAAAQQEAMIAQLEAGGARALRLDRLLETAIEAAKRSGAWQARAQRLAPDIPDGRQLTTAALLGRTGARDPLAGLAYVRDFAVMLPRGLLFCNVDEPTRMREADLLRFIFAFAPALRDYPVVFDARQAGLRLFGGDIQLLDRHTLLFGTGNHSDPRLAPLLAQRTGMDVIAVNIRNADPARWPLDQDPLRDFHLHLNSSVAQLGHDHALVLPWVFETQSSNTVAVPQLVARFGNVRRYIAHSGQPESGLRGVKLADYLRMRGMRVSFVAGAEADGERWLAEATLRRAIVPLGERQAVNMLGVGPETMLALAGSPRTHASLHRKGVRVVAVKGAGLGNGYAGPHSLALPLERT